MKMFPNSSAGVARFGYALLGTALLSSVVFFISFPSDFIVQYFNGSVAIAGLVAISVANQLRNLEKRLEKIEARRG